VPRSRVSFTFLQMGIAASRMAKRRLFLYLGAFSLSTCLCACSAQHKQATLSASDSASSHTASQWNERLAAAYLDQREEWWMGWEHAARGDSTFCVSCHTSVPYLLARPRLDVMLGQAPSIDERKVIDDVVQRVRNWNNERPYYADSKEHPKQSQNSRGTESVLNALILVNRDFGTGRLSDDAQVALHYMWQEQIQTGPDKGAWPWQQFGLEPWESRNSVYYGATLAAAAVGMAPEDYRSSPPVRAHVALLRDYLSATYDDQCMFNRIELLWAASRFPGLIDPALESQAIKQTLASQRADGGWSFSSLVAVDAWNLARLMAVFNRRRDGTPLQRTSDGLATGMAVSALLQAGVSAQNQQVLRGIDWLRQHQNASDGSWSADSYNQERDPDSYIGRFMSDAATGYAVLALSESAGAPSMRGGS
jgi:squalene-hopene/tetraprenyl-beta-curcumene cyclase